MWQLFIKEIQKVQIILCYRIIIYYNLRLLLLFDLLFRREVLRQQLNDFLIILFFGSIERVSLVGIEAKITVSLDCAIAAKVD